MPPISIPFPTAITAITPRSVNYHISRVCNYKCSFCFHTNKNSYNLPLTSAFKGLHLLKQAKCEKVNFAGGEPFMNPSFWGSLCKESNKLGLAVSSISNGSLVSDKWMDEYARYVDILGISLDSFNPSTNALIGRGGDANNKHTNRVMRVREMCDRDEALFKINTVVCSLNHEEDMNTHIKSLDLYRWKAFQVLLLEIENSEKNSLRDATNLTVTSSQFDDFIQRHKTVSCLVPESNDLMKDSYLLLDESMAFMNCESGGKVSSSSILDVGVEKALLHAGFREDLFVERGGVYEWERKR